MISIEEAKAKAEKLAYGERTNSIREVDNFYLIQLGPGEKNTTYGYTVLVDKDTGKAERIILYSPEGLDLITRSTPV